MLIQKSGSRPADIIMSLPYTSRAMNEDVSRLGVIVLQSDASLELELQQALAGSSVVCHYARIENAVEVTPETLKQMRDRLPSTAGLLATSLELKAIGYACTSGSLMIGADEVKRLVQGQHPKAEVTNPMSSAVKACKALKLENIAYISPYIDEVSQPMRDEFINAGINVGSYASFLEERDDKVATIAEESTLEAILKLHDKCDGVFVSCTNLRTFGIIKQAEDKIQKPVLSSNQVLLWDLLKLSGASFRPKNLGRLFSK